MQCGRLSEPHASLVACFHSSVCPHSVPCGLVAPTLEYILIPAFGLEHVEWKRSDSAPNLNVALCLV